MEQRQVCFSLGSLVLLMAIVSLPATTRCTEETYTSVREVEADGSIAGAAWKRFDHDIDYDSFISLMGRRDAAPTNDHNNILESSKGMSDRILARLLGWRTPKANGVDLVQGQSEVPSVKESLSPHCPCQTVSVDRNFLSVCKQAY